MVPKRIPPTMTGFIKAPTSPLSLYRTYSGVFMTHKDDSHPLLKENRDIFIILNQSGENISFGPPTSKAVSRKIAINIVLE